MNWLIVTPEKQAELDAINAWFTDKQCTSVANEDGILLTNSDKLEDAYWSAYHAFLSSLTPFEGEPIWPKPPTINEEQIEPTNP
jgi:hypothetical protein